MTAGFSVLGSGNEVPIVVRAGCVDEAVGAIPSASGQLTQDVDAPRWIVQAGDLDRICAMPYSVISRPELCTMQNTIALSV